MGLIFNSGRVGKKNCRGALELNREEVAGHKKIMSSILEMWTNRSQLIKELLNFKMSKNRRNTDKPPTLYSVRLVYFPRALLLSTNPLSPRPLPAFRFSLSN